MYAAERGDMATIELALALGADLRATRAIGSTPLDFALVRHVKGPHLAAAQALIAAGLPVDERTSTAETTTFWRRTFKGCTTLMVAAWIGDRAAVHELLERGADAQAQGDLSGMTALDYARASPHPNAGVLELLGAQSQSSPAPTDPDFLAGAMIIEAPGGGRAGAAAVLEQLEKHLPDSVSGQGAAKADLLFQMHALLKSGPDTRPRWLIVEGPHSAILVSREGDLLYVPKS
jgi:ankyrin repeat protein